MKLPEIFRLSKTKFTPKKLWGGFAFLIGIVVISLYCSDRSVIRELNRVFLSPNDFNWKCPPFVKLCRSTPSSEHKLVCRIPELEPFHESVKRFTKDIPQKGDYCTSLPVLFYSTLESEVIPAVNLKQFRELGIRSCCYYSVFAKTDEENPDKKFRYANNCTSISLTNATKIKDKFIAIFCEDNKNNTSVYDMHPFVPEQLQSDNLSTSTLEDKPSVDRLNVVIFGLDSLARMNFIRTMPKTYNYVLNTLKAVELQGYNRNGLNTFECILPMLTSQNVDYVSEHCGKSKYYDTCPLIWKKFKAKGYTTSMGEDWQSVSIFHYLKNGFRTPPADHYLRPFALAADKEFQKGMKQRQHCTGPRFSIESLMNYAQKFTYRMDKENKSHFGFTWATALTHNHLHYGKMIDSEFRKFMRWFKNGGHLEKTVFILMSDHGIFWGDIRKSFQGQLETRLPFIYYIFPESFKQKYSRAFANIQGNAKRLTSAMDIYYTLTDLTDIPSKLSNDKLIQREKELSEKTTLPEGISQFLPIPLRRTCADAGIEEFYCACKDGIKKVPTTSSIVHEATDYVVAHLNKLIKNYPKCARLYLRNITHAQTFMARQGDGDAEDVKKIPAYLLSFETTPGNGGFEALVHHYKDKPSGSQWDLSGSVSRASLYGNQSYCVDDVYLKYYCYCKR